MKLDYEAPFHVPEAKCVRCGSEMERGFIHDGYSSSPNRHLTVGAWTSGTPKYGFLGLKVDVAETHLCFAFRCRSCGVLEFFAP